MSDDERKLMFETAIAVAALIELLADGEGLASLNTYRAQFHERMAPLLNKAANELKGLAPTVEYDARAHQARYP